MICSPRLFTVPRAMLLASVLAGCGGNGDGLFGGGGGGNDETVDPSDPDALTSVLIMPDGAEPIDGMVPASSTDSLAPSVTSPVASTTSSNGSTVPLAFDYTAPSGNLGGCYAAIDGASSYFRLPYGGSSSTSGRLQLPIGIPSNVEAGEFCVNFSVYDAQGRTGAPTTQCVNVLRLGTGALQVSLSWSDDSDQDLYVTDPDGDTISYVSPTSSSGGELDRDDTDGYGPENIFWLDSAPDGTYSVSVDHFSGTGPTSFIVTVSASGDSRTFSGTTPQGGNVAVTTFTKRGSTLTF